MTKASALLTAALAFSFCFIGNRAEADRLYLNNGDAITGSLVSLSVSEYEFAVPYGASLRIPRSDVSHLSTTRPVGIVLRSGGRAVGVISSADAGLISIDHLGFNVFRGNLADLESITTLPTSATVSELQETEAKGSHATALSSSPDTLLSQTEADESEEDFRDVIPPDVAIFLESGEVEADLSLRYVRDTSGNVRNRDFTASATISAGITDRLAAFAVLPFTRAERKIVQSPVSGTTNAAGLGDIAIGLSYEIARERIDRPAIISRVTITTPTGKEPDPNNITHVPLGNGQWRASAGVTLIKSFEPIVLFGGLSYGYAFGDTISGVDISDTHALNYNAGVSFRVTNNLSLFQEFLGAYRTAVELEDQEISGLSREPMSLRTGVSIRLGQEAYIQPTITFGLNDDAPDANIRTSYVRRF